MRSCRSNTALLCVALLPAALGLTPAVSAQFLESEVEVLATLVPEVPGGSFGFAGEAIGDINGDGASEYVIGAPNDPGDGTFAGKLFVYDGASGTVLNSFTGSTFQQIGFSVTGGQRIDDDDVPDYAVGGPAGRVVAFSGADHSVIFEYLDPIGGRFLAYDLNMAGDVDRDGRADLIVGAPNAMSGTGQVLVLSGADGSVIWSYDGTEPGGFLGSAVSGLDDLDGDGYPEQGVGAGGGTSNGGISTGVAYVLSGKDGTLLRTLTPEASGSAFGTFFVHDAGDVDRDGTGDIYVGDFGDTLIGPASGRAYVFSGATRSHDDGDDDDDDRGRRRGRPFILPRVYDAELPGDGFGIGRGVGDVDGDRHADIFLAAYTSSAGAPSAGKGYLYSGRDGRLLRTMTGTGAGALLGFDALGLGDVNADGLTDYLLTGIDIAYVIAGIDHDDDRDDDDDDRDDDDDDRDDDDD